MTLFVVELRFLESMLYIIALWCMDACTRYNANLARVGKNEGLMQVHTTTRRSAYCFSD